MATVTVQVVEFHRSTPNIYITLVFDGHTLHVEIPIATWDALPDLASKRQAVLAAARQQKVNRDAEADAGVLGTYTVSYP